MNKKIIWIVIAILVIAGVVYLAKKTPKTEAPTTEGETATEEVTSENVASELDGVDTGDVEGELQDIDKELENL